MRLQNLHQRRYPPLPNGQTYGFTNKFSTKNSVRFGFQQNDELSTFV